VAKNELTSCSAARRSSLRTSPPSGGVNAQIAIPKEYVDQFGKTVTTTTIVSATDITYTGAQIVDGIIYRDPVSLGILSPFSDFMPTAADIVSNMEGTPVAIGMSAPFYIKNTTTNDSVFIYLRQNTGVTFMRNSESPTGITIPKDYVLRGRIVTTNVTASTEAVNINLDHDIAALECQMMNEYSWMATSNATTETASSDAAAIS